MDGFEISRPLKQQFDIKVVMQLFQLKILSRNHHIHDMDIGQKKSIYTIQWTHIRKHIQKGFSSSNI